MCINVLMLLLFFISCVMGVHLFPQAPEFVNLGQTMTTMFQVLTGDDWYNVLRGVEKVHPHAWIYFYTFYIVMVFVFLNLFIGVVVNAFQSADKELMDEMEKEEEEISELQVVCDKIQNIETKMETFMHLLKTQIDEKHGIK